MADLNEILKGLDETKIAQEIELEFDMGLKNFPVNSPIVNSYPQLEKMALDFYKYMMKRLFGANISDVIARGFIALLLQKIFPAGVEDAADMATTGVGGGTLAILAKISEGMKKQIVEQYVAGVIDENLDPSDYDERVKLMEAYISKFGGNIPSGQAKKTAEQLAPKAESVLRQHMQIASYFRKSLGKS